MHDDMTAILKCYTEEAVSKSRKNKGAGKKNRKRNHQESNAVPEGSKDTRTHSNNHDSASPLAQFSDDELLKEIVRRKSQKFKLAGAMKRLDDEALDAAEAAKKSPTV